MRLHDGPLATVPVRCAPDDIVDGEGEFFQLPGLVSVHVRGKERPHPLILRKCVKFFEALSAVAQAPPFIPALVWIEGNQDARRISNPEKVSNTSSSFA
jgi:hypothetical protein